MASKRDQLENEVESYLRRRVEQAGGRCVKFVPDFARGFPDRIVLLPRGVLVWVETKRPRGGVLSPTPKPHHVPLRRLGPPVELVWTTEEADALVTELTGSGTREDAGT